MRHNTNLNKVQFSEYTYFYHGGLTINIYKQGSAFGMTISGCCTENFNTASFQNIAILSGKLIPKRTINFTLILSSSCYIKYKIETSGKIYYLAVGATRGLYLEDEKTVLNAYND